MALNEVRTKDVLRCDDCGTIVAEVRNGVLLIEVRHHGEKHITIIPLDRLTKAKIR